MSVYNQNDIKETVASLLGAAKIGASSESSGREYLLNGNSVVLKIVGMRNNSITITYKMLDRLDAIVIALEMIKGVFDVYLLSVADFKRYMSKADQRKPPFGTLSGNKVKMYGEYIQRVSLGETRMSC